MQDSETLVTRDEGDDDDHPAFNRRDDGWDDGDDHDDYDDDDDDNNEEDYYSQYRLQAADPDSLRRSTEFDPREPAESIYFDESSVKVRKHVKRDVSADQVVVDGQLVAQEPEEDDEFEYEGGEEFDDDEGSPEGHGESANHQEDETKDDGGWGDDAATHAWDSRDKLAEDPWSSSTAPADDWGVPAQPTEPRPPASVRGGTRGGPRQSAYLEPVEVGAGEFAEWYIHGRRFTQRGPTTVKLVHPATVRLLFPHIINSHVSCIRQS
jgi:hypothetical protein